MKKKLIAVIAAAALALSFAPAAFAASAGMSNFKTSASYSEATFTDVESSAWYASSVQACYEYGLMNGSADKIFNPDGNLTVAEAIVMADRVYEIYNSGSSTLANGTPWYQPYVDYAAANGIIKDGDFSSYTDKVTRAQMAYIFSNALPSGEFGVINSVSTLPDVKSTDKYGEEIFTLYNAGILTGNDDYGTFSPEADIARREAAAVIARVAVPDKRVCTNLYEKFSNGIVTLAMPQGSEYSKISETISYYSSADGATLSSISSSPDSNLNGISITAHTPDCFSDVIVSELNDEGYTATLTESKQMKFGSTDVYMFELNVVYGNTDTTCYYYIFIDGISLYEVTCASNVKADLTAFADNLQINGSKAA